MKYWFSKRRKVWGLVQGNVTHIIREQDLNLDPKKFLISCPVCHGSGYDNAGRCARCAGTGFDGGFD